MRNLSCGLGAPWLTASKSKPSTLSDAWSSTPGHRSAIRAYRPWRLASI